MTYKFSGVPIELIENARKEVTPFIDKVIPYTGGRYETEDIFDFLKDGRMTLWVCFHAMDQKINGIVVTYELEYPRKRVFNILLCAGKGLKECYKPMLELLEKVAKKRKCDSIEVNGRQGWMRLMKKDGYKEVTRLIEKEI